MRSTVLTGATLALLVVLASLAAAHGQTAAPTAATINAQVIEVEPFHYMGYECTGPYSNFALSETAFHNEFRKSGVRPIGCEIVLYWNSPLYVKPEFLKWDIGYPVASGQASLYRMTVKQYPYRKVARAIHRGSYLTTYVTINALYAWIHAQGLKAIGGPCMERYLDQGPDKLLASGATSSAAAGPAGEKTTEIWIPVK